MNYFQIVVETFPITCNGIFHVESVKNILFYYNYKRKLTTCDKLLWCWRNTKKTPQTSSLNYFQIVVETFPITCNGIFHNESVKNTLFYNNYKRKLISCHRLHWCCRNTKKRPKHLAWIISKSWWRPFLSHVMVFFMLNQWRILCFTIIIRENSLHVTSCFGVEEIPKNVPNI
jgi:hypothetical protein